MIRIVATRIIRKEMILWDSVKVFIFMLWFIRECFIYSFISMKNCATFGSAFLMEATVECVGFL